MLYFNKTSFSKENTMILGLTGGIASGKSTVSAYFREMGTEVVDADLIAREVSERKEVVEKLVEVFGEGILDKTSEKYRLKIDRRKLREIVFSDRKNVKIINSIIHPSVIGVFEERRKSSHPDEIMIFDIPLLFEAKLEYLCDRILVVTADEDIQIERIRERDGSSLETAKSIIKNQMSAEEKSRRADYTITNNSGISELKEQVVKVYEKIKGDLAG